MTEESLVRGTALLLEIKTLNSVLSVCNSDGRQIDISVDMVNLRHRLGSKISVLVFDHIRSLVERELELAREEFEKL